MSLDQLWIALSLLVFLLVSSNIFSYYKPSYLAYCISPSQGHWGLVPHQAFRSSFLLRGLGPFALLLLA